MIFLRAFCVNPKKFDIYYTDNKRSLILLRHFEIYHMEKEVKPNHILWYLMNERFRQIYQTLFAGFFQSNYRFTKFPLLKASLEIWADPTETWNNWCLKNLPFMHQKIFRLNFPSAYIYQSRKKLPKTLQLCISFKICKTLKKKFYKIPEIFSSESRKIMFAFFW